MSRKFFLTTAALFCAMQLFADITLDTVGMANPILVIYNDNSKYAQSLIAKKYEEYVASQAANENDYLAKAMMTYEALLPPEAKKNKKFVIALTGNFGSISDMMVREKYLRGKLIGAVTYPIPVKNVFDMMGILPLIAPEINSMVEIAPITVEGYSGYSIKDKMGYNIVGHFLISKDEKTILFGAPELMQKQLTAPIQFPPIVLNARKATEEQAGTMTFVFPEGLKKDLKENLLDESSLDAAIKDALGGSMALTVAWESDSANATTFLMTTLADEPTATLLNTQLITPWLIPTAQQMVPALIGESYSFPSTFRAVQKSEHVGFSAEFTESDMNMLAVLIKNSIENTDEEEGDENSVIESPEPEEDKETEKTVTEQTVPATEQSAPAPKTE